MPATYFISELKIDKKLIKLSIKNSQIKWETSFSYEKFMHNILNYITADRLRS
jgi:hypothetical protein